MKEDKCAACSLSDFTDDFGPRCILYCTSCVKQWHISCIKESLGLEVEPSVIDDDRDWFCSESCKEVTSGLAKLQGRRQCLSKAERRYTYELAKYRSGDRESSATIAAALKIFKSSFGPLIMDDGADLIENVCKSSSSGELDCGNFRVLVLRDGPTTVTAATIRIFGTEFAEVPFVATKIGFRRGGNCRRLMQVLDNILLSLKGLVQMWAKSFGLEVLKKSELAHYEEKIICPDLRSSTMMRRCFSYEVKPPITCRKRRLPKLSALPEPAVMSPAVEDDSVWEDFAHNCTPLDWGADICTLLNTWKTGSDNNSTNNWTIKGCSFTELLNEPMLVDKLPPCPATPALRPMEPHGAQWPASSVLRNTYLTACSIVIEKAMTEFRKQVEASVADFEAESFKKLGKMGGDVDKMECLVKSLQARKMETERERSNMKVKKGLHGTKEPHGSPACAPAGCGEMVTVDAYVQTLEELEELRQVVGSACKDTLAQKTSCHDFLASLQGCIQMVKENSRKAIGASYVKEE